MIATRINGMCFKFTACIWRSRHLCWTPVHTELLENTLLLSKHIRTKNEALIAIGRYMNKTSLRPQDIALRYLRKEMLSHVGYEDADFRKKAFEFCEHAVTFSEQLYIDQIMKENTSQFRELPEPFDNNKS